MRLQALPKLQPIKRLSPTLFDTLKQCSLRAGLRNVKAQQTTRGSKAALLGTLVHQVLEEAVSVYQAPEDVRAAAEKIWDRAKTGMEQKLHASPLDRSLLPIERWKRYAILRERTLRRYVDIASGQGPSETQVIARERQFRSATDEFTGKPDLILRRANGLVIVDYKSTEFSDDAHEQEKKIESWRQQILFYAVLIKRAFGEWPVAGEIRLLNTEVIPISIDPIAAEGVMAEAQVLKSKFNAKIDADVPQSTLAQYSADNCKFCEFKGACDTFWEQTPPPDPETDEYGYITGTVSKITTGRSGISSLVIESEKSDGSSQTWQISHLSNTQFEDLETLKQGDSVRLIDFKIDSNSPYRAKSTQNSVIWKLPDSL